MIELYNALKLITMLFFYSKDINFNLGVSFLKSVIILFSRWWNSSGVYLSIYFRKHSFWTSYPGRLAFTS